MLGLGQKFGHDVADVDFHAEADRDMTRIRGEPHLELPQLRVGIGFAQARLKEETIKPAGRS